MDSVSGFKTRSILAVPMVVKGRLIGVVEAINKRGGVFTAQDLRTFEGFAAQAAVAIENARLFSSLREERFKLETIFSEMSDAALLTTRDGVVLLANPAARKLLGLGESATLDAALRPFLTIPPLREALAGREPLDFEAARAKPTRLMLAGRATPVEAGWLLVFRDVTEAWRRDHLQRSFLSLISHKLKTPLASVLGYADILKEEYASKPPASPFLAKAADSVWQQGRKLADLVDKLLRYATLSNEDAAFELAPCPLDPLIDETTRGMGEWLRERGATVLHRAGDPVVARADRDKVAEALKCLLENAVKFDPRPAKEVAVWAELAGGQALLTVKDAGPGIPPEELERVFHSFHQIETYFTGQIDGWGLGLPYVKRVAEGHGGGVDLRSRLGEGTTVTMRLPA
jgi:signal transduction histidine kinase